MTDDGTEFIDIPVEPISEAQLQALREAQFSLPQHLEPLSSLLGELLTACEARALHQTPIEVRIET